MNWVKIGDAPTQGNYITKTAEKIRPEGLSKTREVHPGDLILSNSMSFGKPYIMGIDGCIHDGWLLIRNTYGVFDLTFLCHLLGTPQMLSQYRSLAAGSTVNNLNKELVGNTVVTIPSITEQQVLGDYLEQLDNRITLHQRQPFLHSTPDISLSVRLIHPFYTSSWEQRKLGDIADIVGGGTPSTGNQSYWDGDIDWYAPAEIADQIYANSSQKKITGLGYENSSAKMLPPGTVLFTSRAGIGKTAILTRKGCTNQGFQSIVPHRGELDSYFIFSRTGELKRYGELVGAGSTFVEVSGKQMVVMELMMPPTMREQQIIGGFFQQLDHLITLHQRKGKAAVSGCFLNCFSLEKSSAQSRTLELFGQISNQEIKYIIDGLSILGGKLRNFCVKLIILLGYTRINDIAKYHISRNTKCVHNIN